MSEKSNNEESNTNSSESSEKNYDTELKNYLREKIIDIELTNMSSDEGDYLGMTGPMYVDIKQLNHHINRVDTFERKTENVNELFYNLVVNNPELQPKFRIFDFDFNDKNIEYVNSMKLSKYYKIIYLDTKGHWMSIKQITPKLIEKYFKDNNVSRPTYLAIGVTRRGASKDDVQTFYSEELSSLKEKLIDQNIFTTDSINKLFTHLDPNQFSSQFSSQPTSNDDILIMDLLAVLVPYSLITGARFCIVECKKIIAYGLMYNFLFEITPSSKKENEIIYENFKSSIEKVPLQKIIKLIYNENTKQVEEVPHGTKLPTLEFVKNKEESSSSEN